MLKHAETHGPQASHNQEGLEPNMGVSSRSRKGLILLTKGVECFFYG